MRISPFHVGSFLVLILFMGTLFFVTYTAFTRKTNRTSINVVQVQKIRQKQHTQF